MKKTFVLKIVFLILISLLVYAPATPGKSPKEPDLKGFEKFVTKTMDEWEVPGLAIVVIKDEKVILSKGFGYRDIKKKLNVTPNTLFAIGSCTKAFTATAMGILVDDNKLNWDSPVRDYLPTFKLFDPMASEGMTPQDLVCHRSGLPRHDAMWYNSSASRKELFDRLRYLKSSKDFRVLFQYQNLMFMTSGYLVGQVSGTTWEKFIQDHFFTPLGMNGSNFSVEDSKKAADFALPYTEKDEQVIEIPFRNIDTIGPAGSINSNVTDMANWLLLNLNKGKFGEKQIVSESSLKEIHSPQMIASKTLRYDEMFYSLYGMGWSITSYRGHPMLSHGGGIDGFTALVSFMPKDNIGLVILTNRGGTPVPQIFAYNVYDRLLGLEPVDWEKRIRDQRNKAKKEAEKSKKEKGKDRKPNTTPSHPLEDYVGEYENPGYGVLYIKKDGDNLKATYNSIEFEVEHYHYDIFEFKNELLDMNQKASFFTDVKGHIGSLSVQFEPAVDEIVFDRIPEKIMMEKGFLKKFVGEYEIQGMITTVTLKGDKTLFLYVPGQPEYELVPYKGSEFTVKNLKGYSVEFVTDDSGVVTEAKFHQPNGVFTAKKK